MVWDIVYYRKANGRVPGDEFLAGCPVKVRARLLAVLDDVAEAPPPQFSGGGRWEAMHGTMPGYYEIRIQGPGREQFRLFCILENAEREELGRRGLAGPTIAVINGLRKQWMTRLRETDYRAVRRRPTRRVRDRILTTSGGAYRRGLIPSPYVSTKVRALHSPRRASAGRGP